MTGLNIASREVMKSAQVIDCTGANTLDQSLQQVRVETTHLIIAAITDHLLANGFCGTIYATVDPILTSVFKSISSYCVAHPILQVGKCPVLAGSHAHLLNNFLF